MPSQDQSYTHYKDSVNKLGYEILGELGHGAYGIIFLAQPHRTRDYVAIKVIPKENHDEYLDLQRLEFDIQKSLCHPNLLYLHNVHEDRDTFYMIMELCDEGDLFDYVVKDDKVNEVRDPAFVKTVFMQILDAVEHMHKEGVYHRDLKLENILLTLDDKNNYRCKIGDFGLATRLKKSNEFGCGSSRYLAPEHFDDDSLDDLPAYYDAAASDVWSLGILLLHLMFACPPWRKANSSDANFAEFLRNPSVLQSKLFPRLSLGAFHLVKSTLAVNAVERPSISQLKQMFAALGSLYDDHEHDDIVEAIEDDEVTVPLTSSAVTIPSKMPTFHPARALCDSAYGSLQSLDELFCPEKMDDDGDHYNDDKRSLPLTSDAMGISPYTSTYHLASTLHRDSAYASYESLYLPPPPCSDKTMDREDYGIFDHYDSDDEEESKTTDMVKTPTRVSFVSHRARKSEFDIDPGGRVHHWPMIHKPMGHHDYYYDVFVYPSEMESWWH